MAFSRINFIQFAGVALGIYLVCDAFLDGPLFRTAASLLASDHPIIVARVHGREITSSQLERAVRERLLLEGKNTASPGKENLKAARDRALDGLIDHELLRSRADALAPGLKVSKEEIDARLARMSSRFRSKDDMESAMKSQGIPGMKELRDRLAAQIQQEKYVALTTAPLVRATDDAARKWFDENRGDLTIPERVEVRHVFISTLDHPTEEAKAKLDAALADLTAKKKDFATLARELSEDPATKDKGGSLGWMTRRRLPVDFAAPVFAMAVNQPALVRSRLGWHLVEVTGRKPAEQPTFEEAKPEILAALEAVERTKAVVETRDSTHRANASTIEIFKDRPDK